METQTPSYHTSVVTRWFRQLSSAPVHSGAFARAVGISLLLATASVGCAGPGQFTWYSELPKSEWESIRGEYVIAIGDSISIRVYEQDGVSGSFKIRRDGRISLPLAGEMMVAGKHPSRLAREIEGLLKQFIVSPKVTVNIESSQPVTVTSVGEIGHIGTITLEPPAQLIQALAQGGEDLRQGFLQLAGVELDFDADRLFVKPSS